MLHVGLKRVLLLVVVALVAAAGLAEPIGLVLSGGGTKGAYEVGVWKAICELGLDTNIVAISGTSIGSINAAAFATARDPEKCIALWRESMPGSFRLKSNPRQYSAQRQAYMAGLAVAMQYALHNGKKQHPQGGPNFTGVCSHENLRKMLTGQLPEKWPQVCPEVYAAAMNQASGKVRYFSLRGRPRDQVAERLMASSALPGLFDPVVVDGVAYVDGGICFYGDGDNVPAIPILKNHPEVKQIIVVMLFDVKPWRYPGIETTVISLADGNSMVAMVDISKGQMEHLIQRGYDDAMRALRGPQAPFVAATARLGVRYSTGDRVPRDLEKARECFRRAAAQGDEESKKRLASLPRQ